MMCTGSTRKFDPSQVVDVLPKMILTLAIDITGESIYSSNKAVKMVMYVHRLANLFFEEYPDQRKVIENRIDKFIKDEKN